MRVLSNWACLFLAGLLGLTLAQGCKKHRAEEKERIERAAPKPSQARRLERLRAMRKRFAMRKHFKAAKIPTLTAAEKRCKGDGCSRLGFLQARGRKPARAVAFFLHGCDTGGKIACAMAGMGFERGMGIKSDPPRAVKLYQRSCKMGYPKGCYNLALMYGRGATGVPKNTAMAEGLLRKTCKSGDKRGCYSLGDWLIQHGKRAQGVKLLKKSCKMRHFKACLALRKMGIKYK